MGCFELDLRMIGSVLEPPYTESGVVLQKDIGVSDPVVFLALTGTLSMGMGIKGEFRISKTEDLGCSVMMSRL